MPARKAIQPHPAETGPNRLDALRFSPANRRRLSGPGLRTFLAICDLWGLTEDQRRLVLGFHARSTCHNWAKSARDHRDILLDVDVLTRISAVLAIHQALGVLHNSEREAVAWLRGTHRAAIFGGRPPVDLMASGTQDGVLSVRRLLDAARGGLYMPPNERDCAFMPCREADVVFA